MDHHEAFAVINAGIAEATKLGVPMSIAVVDARTDLVAQVRMDGAYRLTVDIARGKALVSTIFLRSSGAVADDNSVTRRLNALNQDQLVFEKGAVPIFADGAPAGAVGVSGGTPEMDEQVAEAAAAVKKGTDE
ncbi:GlcG/HbpS family heme-binding protein [Amycolatopsis pithecellobii]|uniref:Heme-binding protein n=1 Tax=Amycolatopsis pithecellobii TaxID=664692 RepID=A0A6N7YZC1_9PSEU|nr:heme-binding protein [Amycolatopsis pithecellobii]MTD52540.1 heme-binding protein [Amycolatopsis pithecellobii]